jgi:arylsulfatase A
MTQICIVVLGRYPFRTGMYGPTVVHLPQHFVGLPHEEVTIAEALRDGADYFTGIIGKWHLGITLLQF